RREGRAADVRPHRAAARARRSARRARARARAAGRERTMKKHVVIVGAGFAGLELAARLSDSLADEVDVTLLDKNDSFYFGFSKLDVLLGRRAPGDVLLHYGDIAKEGV